LGAPGGEASSTTSSRDRLGGGVQNSRSQARSCTADQQRGRQLDPGFIDYHKCVSLDRPTDKTSNPKHKRTIRGADSSGPTSASILGHRKSNRHASTPFDRSYVFDSWGSLLAATLLTLRLLRHIVREIDANSTSTTGCHDSEKRREKGLRRAVERGRRRSQRISARRLRTCETRWPQQHLLPAGVVSRLLEDWHPGTKICRACLLTGDRQRLRRCAPSGSTNSGDNLPRGSLVGRGVFVVERGGMTNSGAN
jgi:hypothetical protein